jgi:hypothetical protein
MAGQDAGEVIVHMEQMAAHPDRSRSYFAVGFRDSKVRIVFLPPMILFGISNRLSATGSWVSSGQTVTSSTLWATPTGE